MQAATIWLALLLPLPCIAESTLRFPVPTTFGVIPAVTYDTEGHPIGKSSISLEKLDSKTIRLIGMAAIDGGGSTRVQADFHIIGETQLMKPIMQMSQSVTIEGRPLGTLRIEHEKGTASCTPPPDSKTQPRSLELPKPDRVVNVPLQMLFVPLAQAQTDAVRFEVLICREDPRFMEFEAVVAHRSGADSTLHNVEIRYGPDLGSVLSLVLSSMLPDLRFWLGGENDDRYLAHRMPLYSKGPEIWVVRDGVQPKDLTAGQDVKKDPSPLAGETHHETRSHASGR